MTWVWGLLAAVALLWPDRVSGPFDGVPLDRAAETVLIGLIVPALCFVQPRFLTTRLARATIGLLLLWRISAAMLFVQDGWCVRFEPSRPLVKETNGAPHAWDLRADWRSADPACSAIMTRSYTEFAEFPVWFFNLPPPSESWPQPEDRPPEATTVMRVRGYVTPTRPGSFDIELAAGMKTTIAIDGRIAGLPTALDAGAHQVAVDATLTGSQWRIVPRWNGEELWSRVTATVNRPSIASLGLRWWMRSIPFTLTIVLLVAWMVSALSRVQHPGIVAWTIGMSLVIAFLVRADQIAAARWTIVALIAAVFVPVPPRLRNLGGAFLLVGVPWLTYIGVAAAPAIGRWVLYDVGHDYWMFQRFAYRIVMQGYWLEGGTPTFYFQPLYRWIAAVLHVVFGDSSVGEWYWDGACLLAGSLLSFRIARSFAGFRWGIVAAVIPLAVFNLSAGRDLVGRGLSEISSAGLLSMAALCAIGSRHRTTGRAIAAGLLATLAFYTRLNNLVMALGVAAFALPLRMPVGALVRLREWRARVAWRTAIAVPAVVAIGVLCFAWRTWYYTGVFSVLHGTQGRSLAVWKPGMTLASAASSIADSVLLVLTVNDPPQFDVLASPVLVGAFVAVLAMLGTPRLRDLPAPAVLFFFAAIAGAFVARGSAYPGRFSVHIIPITCALTVCGAASLFHRDSRVHRVDDSIVSQDPVRAG
jgi:hypothetical protein